MVSYLYQCGAHGCFEIRRPIGDADMIADCPSCGTAGRRVYSAPRLAFAPRDRMVAIDRAERSAEQPEVVSAPEGGRRRAPGAPRPAWAANPALSRLPRP